MRVYVASSWRNKHQQTIVAALSAAGHVVYDFRNPEPGNNGFHWSEIDPSWQGWTPERFCQALDHPVAESGFTFDMNALNGCDACVLVLPCGRSAHLELGYAAGMARRTFVLMLEPSEPELMYKLCDRVCTSTSELLEALAVEQERIDLAQVTL